MIRLLIISNPEITGLQYHRQIVPHHYISDMVEFRCDVATDIQKCSDVFLKEFQAVVFLRSINQEGQSQFIVARLKRLGLKIIFDIDDYWHLEPTHHLHGYYRAKHVAAQTEFDIKNSDLVTTTTEHFALELRKLNQNVVVLPNCLDPQNPAWQPKPISSSLTRFGWIGGVYHEKDIELLSESIKKIYERQKDFQFVLGGYNDNKSYERAEKVLSNNYDVPEEYKGYLNSKSKIAEHYGYFQRYRRLWGIDVFNYGKLYNDIDVALVPLQKNKFTSFKSEIKLIEAGTHGKAVIVSRVKPYDIFPEDCVHYIDANDNANSWNKAIRKFLLEPEYRKELASNLSTYVSKNYNISNWNEVRKSAYKKLLND